MYIKFRDAITLV